MRFSQQFCVSFGPSFSASDVALWSDTWLPRVHTRRISAALCWLTVFANGSFNVQTGHLNRGKKPDVCHCTYGLRRTSTTSDNVWPCAPDLGIPIIEDFGPGLRSLSRVSAPDFGPLSCALHRSELRLSLNTQAAGCTLGQLSGIVPSP